MSMSDLMPAFLVVAMFALILAAIYLRHRKMQMLHLERMAALEKGTAVPVWRTLAPWSPRVYLLRGLMWSMGGAALTLAILGISASTHQPESWQSVMYDSRNLSVNLDIPLEQARKIVEQDRAGRVPGMPSTVALLGLIPLGIGLAYLAFYYTDDKRHKAGAGAEDRAPALQD
jgi:hypothetical protein